MSQFLLDKFRTGGSRTAIIFNNADVSYASLVGLISQWEDKLSNDRVAAGDVVAMIGDFSPKSISLLFALAKRNCVIVPLSRDLDKARIGDFVVTSKASHLYGFSADDELISDENFSTESDPPPLIKTIRERKVPGLVLFSSGSTGKSKAALLNMAEIFKKFEVEKRLFRTAGFLLFDHIGGINTLLYVLSNLGTFITIPNRSPETVLTYIEKYKIELLPTTPTFIKLIIISEAYKEFDLSSLKLITYGTEPMPQQTLNRFLEVVPGVRLQQTYGLTEVGILRSQSRENGSLWVRIGGEGYELRVVDRILQIRSSSTMLGYLNADAPFTEDGWFITGDEVEVDGDYVRILGRKSEIISVGGLKVYPAEIEGEIEMLDFVESATVRGEINAILGNVVTARIKIADNSNISNQEAIAKVKSWCSGRLEPFKVPAKLEITREHQHNIRFKKMR